MALYTILIAGLFAILFLPFFTVKFPKTFYLYLFLFIPLYLLFREFYIRLMYDFPDILKAVKDVVWVYVLICFIFWKLLSKEKIHFPSKLGIALIIFTSYLILQLIRSYDLLGGFTSLLAVRNTLIYIPAILISLSVIKTEDDLYKIVKCFSYVMVAAGIYGLIQMIFRIETAYYILSLENLAVQYLWSSFFSDYNAFGWFCGVALAIMLSSREFFKKNKFMLYIAILLSVFWLIASQSRTGLITLVSIFFLSIVFRVIKISKMAVLVILVLSLLSFLLPDILEQHRIRSGVWGDIRIVQSWPVLWEVYKENPIFGYGFGVFGFAALRGDIDVASISHLGVDNFYLTLALNTGIIGLILFLFLLIEVFRISLNLVKILPDKNMRNMLKGINIALIVNLIYAVSSNFLEGFPQSVYFWFLVGMIPAIQRIYCSTTFETKRKEI